MKAQTTRNRLSKLLGKPTLPFEKFHSATSMKKGPGDASAVLPVLPESLKKIYYKGYPRLKSVALSRHELPPVTLSKALRSRTSYRKFSKKPILTEELGQLLYFSAGERGKSGRRFYPSAGARYPLETYVISLNSQVPKGVYHYYVRSNCLEKLGNTEDFRFNECLSQEWLRTAGCIIIITALFHRTTDKYGDRGYRYALFEAGHIGQNISLIATALGLKSCPIGGFLESGIDAALDLKEPGESPLYLFAVGK